MTSRQVSFYVEDDVLEDFDKLRGDVPRSVYIRKLIKNALNRGGKKKNG